MVTECCHSKTDQIFHEMLENKSVTQLVIIVDTKIAGWSVAMQIATTFFWNLIDF